MNFRRFQRDHMCSGSFVFLHLGKFNCHKPFKSLLLSKTKMIVIRDWDIEMAIEGPILN